MTGSANRRTLAQRLQNGLARRTRALWKRCFHRGPEFPAEATLDWLIRALHDSPADLRAMCRETLLDYGCADVVSSWNEVRDGQSASPSPPPVSCKEEWHAQVLAAKDYLNAAQSRVSAAFDGHGQELPHTIDASDGRMVAVLEWMASLPATAAVADVGCGSGRFLMHLAKQFPEAELTGIDPCSTLLDQLPPSVRKHQGTLLRTNLPDATFDAALAVESLEHCLVAKRGIAELCRIVRPGGGVLVIDKDRSKQALSECEPWERWFHPHELTEWLEPFCDEISIEPVSHREGLRGETLFLAASGKRR